MAEPVQLKAVAVADGFLAIRFTLGDKIMVIPGFDAPGEVVLQYPRQGEPMRERHQQTETERKADVLNGWLKPVNDQLREWCS